MTSHAPAPIFVFAVADGRFLHGNVIPNPDGPGRFIGFTAASLSDALVAYDSVARVAGSFSLTTHGSSKVDFEFVRPGFLGRFAQRLRWPATHVVLDIWFEVDPDDDLPDVWLLSIDNGRRFVERAFANNADTTLWRDLQDIARDDRDRPAFTNTRTPHE